VPKSSRPSLAFFQVVNPHKPRSCNGHYHQLRNAISVAYRYWAFTEVDHQHLYFASVIAIDRPWRVEQR